MSSTAVETEAERERGRAARKRLPRSALGSWTVLDRDPTDSLIAACAGCVPTLLPIRWSRMSASPFTFFRGSAALMAADISPRPHSGIESQICGDAHILNVGAFGSPEGRLAFDINDFDETVRAPFEWDLLRFAVSLRLGGQEAACGRRQLDAAVLAFSHAYRSAMDRFASMPFIDVFFADVKRIVTERPTQRILRKAKRASGANVLAALVDFAASYAAQTRRDQFLAAIRDKRIRARAA